jgi:hypothetical protein
MMKRRIATCSCALAALIWICAPAQAEYKGELPRDRDFTINVDNSAVTGKTAITVYYLGNRPDEIEFTAPAGAQVSYVAPKPGKGVTRVIVQVDPPTNGAPGIEVSSNHSFPHNCLGHTVLVFDVE